MDGITPATLDQLQQTWVTKAAEHQQSLTEAILFDAFTPENKGVKREKGDGGGKERE